MIADSDQDQISRIVDRQQDAWNRGDALAFADDCHPDMSFTNIESRMFVGRQLFEERHRLLFDDAFRASTLSMSIKRIWLPAKDVAIVDVGCVLAGFRRLPEGVTPASNGCLHTNLMEVLVRSDGGWRVVAYHNVDV